MHQPDHAERDRNNFRPYQGAACQVPARRSAPGEINAGVAVVSALLAAEPGVERRSRQRSRGHRLP